jgi:POT family proton-dependent oligopeptide transporter
MTARPLAPTRRHPSALYLLSLIELCERLAFGAVLPLLALYVHEHLGRSEAFAIALSSIFLAGSYLASLPGGFLADRVLGAIGALSVGVLLLTVGFVGLALDLSTTFWPALGALLVGQGLVKPGITAAVGGLYPDGDGGREAGFSIFYIAVNLGAFAGPLLAEWARARWGWPSIFACAAAAMLPALVLLIPAIPRPTKQVPHLQVPKPSLTTKDEWARVQALILLCAVTVFFWLAFQQTGTSLALFAEEHTAQRLTLLRWKLTLRPGHFAALHAGLVIGFTPLLLGAIDRLRRRRADPSTPQKMVWGFLLTAAAFALVAGAALRGGDAGRVSPLWLAGCYGLLSLGELLISPRGLSMVTDLAPPRLAGRFMGLWFASVAVGHGFAAGLGLLWSGWPHHRYFAAVAALSLLAAAVLRQRLVALDSAIARRP